MFSRVYFSVVLTAVLISGTALAGDSPKGNVHPNLKLSFSERFRMVSWDNAITMDDSAEGGNAFTRHRTSVGGQWFPTDRLEFGLKLTNEFRYYFVPENTEFTMHEVFVDQLYAKYNHGPVTLTLGRQDIVLGEGFVVLDGGPLDGSRSIYFNAARADIKPCPDGNMTLFYFYQPEEEDYLPLIHDQNRGLVEQPEEGFGAYFSRDFNKINVQTYYIRKNIDSTDTHPIASGINLVGGRISLPLTGQLSFTGEGAYQFGTFGEIDRAAMGGYARLDYKTEWPVYLPKKLTAGGVFLSGDDPKTEDWEGWDPMFGRWPKWSEMYIYTLVPENGVAYWSNYASLYGQAHFDITADIGFRAEYQHLWAPQQVPTGVPVLDARENVNNRGDMLIGKLTYTINKYLSGHVVWEHFFPGGFYVMNPDEATWLRFQLVLSVQ